MALTGNRVSGLCSISKVYVLRRCRMATAQQYPITSGPSKFELSISLFDRKPQARSVVFHTNCPLAAEVQVTITSVQAEDGSGESWNIEGYVSSATLAKGVRQPSYIPENNQRTFIYFRTDRRQGYIRFFEKKETFTLAEVDEIVRQSNERQFGDGRPVRR